MRCFLALMIFISVPTLAKAKPEPVRLHYSVDGSHAAKRLLRIQVQIDGLPEGRNTIGLPASKNSSSNKISHVGWQSEDGSLSPLTLEDGQVVVESSGGEPVTLAFQLHSESFQHLDRATYLDESRCLFHPQDILLEVENQDPNVLLSFLLPDQWDVVSMVPRAIDGTFSIETTRATPFYLGKAEKVHDATSSLLWMAIEPGWPPAPQLLALLNRQVRHRLTLGRDAGSRPLLAVFLSPSRSLPNKEWLAFGGPQLLAYTAGPGMAEPSLATPLIQQAVARGLVRMYFPVIANFSASVGPEQLIDYLTLKACRKTGVLGRAEFLDVLAQQLWNALGEPAEVPAKPRSNARTGRTVTSPTRGRFCGLLLDLALSFYGDTSRSLEAFLASWSASSTDEPIQEDDLRKRLRREQQAATALVGVWQNEDPQKIGELLRPFGLLFDRRELPAFGFQLTETFQIAELGRQVQETGTLETGDRILAINNYRLMLPDDLLKCRSRLTPGQEVQLDVERRNLPLRVTQRVTKEILLKLEINKLADADKQQKLEQFLSVEAEGK